MCHPLLMCDIQSNYTQCDWQVVCWPVNKGKQVRSLKIQNSNTFKTKHSIWLALNYFRFTAFHRFFYKSGPVREIPRRSLNRSGLENTWNINVCKQVAKEQAWPVNDLKQESQQKSNRIWSRMVEKYTAALTKWQPGEVESFVVSPDDKVWVVGPLC